MKSLINPKPLIGKKKTSVAKCNFYSLPESNFTLLVNNKGNSILESFFLRLLPEELRPNLNGILGKVWVKGGGFSSQKLAILKSLTQTFVSMFPESKSTLKKIMYLWFDSRKVERKKPGLKKARKAQQWVKR